MQGRRSRFVILLAGWACILCGCQADQRPVDGGLDAGTEVDGAGEPEGAADRGPACLATAPRNPPAEVFVAPASVVSGLIGRIDAAGSSIDVMMYQLTLDSFVDAFLRAHGRGVRVRVLLDGEQGVNASARSRLAGGGVEVRSSPASLSHAHSKVLIFDATRAVVMSANLNDYLESERNYGVVVEDTQDLADLQEIFDADWSDTPFYPPSCTRLLVSPWNSRDRLRDLIRSARTTLDLAVMYLSDDELKDEVKVAASAGVAVRVLLASPAWIDGNADTAVELQGAGAEVRYFTRYDLHAKLVVADGIAFVGSQNLSWTSLERNREVGLLVNSASSSATAVEQFESDWQQGNEP